MRSSPARFNQEFAAVSLLLAFASIIAFVNAKPGSNSLQGFWMIAAPGAFLLGSVALVRGWRDTWRTKSLALVAVVLSVLALAPWGVAAFLR